MLSTTQINQVGNFDQSTISNLGRALGTKEALTVAGALSLNVFHSTIAVSGTMAMTLAAPTVSGQRKKVTAISAASTPAATLTVASPDDTAGFVCPATFFFDGVGQELEFEATPALKWRCIRKKRAGAPKVLVIGTTVTTGIADMTHLSLSVTGTVASLTTKGVPNGAAVGELLCINCSTAASTPHGDIAGAFATITGAAATALDDFTAVTDAMTFEWNGSAWQLLINNTTAVTLT